MGLSVVRTTLKVTKNIIFTCRQTKLLYNKLHKHITAMTITVIQIVSIRTHLSKHDIHATQDCFIK